MNVILLGAPGSGKGTQGALLAEKLGVPKIATGDLLRAAVKDGTPLGMQAKDHMTKGLLVPDEIILDLIREVLEAPEAAHGVIMDGFPRTVAQAEAVDELLRERDSQVDHVLTIDVSDADLVERLLERASQQGRSDDTAVTIQQRLAVYYGQTAPLIEFYRDRGILVDVDGVGRIEQVSNRVAEALKV